MKKIFPICLFFILFFGMACFSQVLAQLFNIDLSNISQNLKIIYNLFFDIIFILIVFLLYRKTIVKDFKDYFKNFKTNFNKYFKYYLIGLIIMNVSSTLIAILFKDAIANNEESVRGMIDLYPAYMLFYVSIYAPFIEEIIFRKNIFDCVNNFINNKFSKYLYVLISGFIFAALHVFGTTGTYLDYLYIIPYLSLGIAFALVYYDSRNIFSTISLHFLHNFVAFILYFIRGGIL